MYLSGSPIQDPLELFWANDSSEFFWRYQKQLPGLKHVCVNLENIKWSLEIYCQVSNHLKVETIFVKLF